MGAAERSNGRIEVKVRLLNTLVKYGRQWLEGASLSLPPRATTGTVAEKIGIPSQEIHLLLINGKPPDGVMVNLRAALAHGDQVCFSGPVPFHKAWGLPMC